MRINLKIDSTTPMNHKKLVFNAIMEMMETYHVGDSGKRDAIHYFQSTLQGKKYVCEFLNKKYGITATPYSIGDEDAVFSEGYEIDEDQYLTKLLLTL